MTIKRNIQLLFCLLLPSIFLYMISIEFVTIPRYFSDISVNKLPKDFPFDEECFFKSYPNFSPPLYYDEDFAFLKTVEGKKYKTILFYNGYAMENFAFGLGYKPFHAACCKERRCFLTKNRTAIGIEKYDALLFEFRTLRFVKIPIPRKRSQRWIFFEREPPSMVQNPQKYNGVFNWTMTYRRDSDIVAPYGRVYPKAAFSTNDFVKFTRNASSPKELLRTKKKPIAWFVSHCSTSSRRENYAQELQNYIQIDKYGACGNLKCDKAATRKPQCYEMLEREYKFYLSFENSLCTDYVSEKFFNILNYNIVPIVRGTGDYAKIAPPHSYIDVRDFKTVKDLAQYLKYLDQNDTAYLEYYRWKVDYISPCASAIFHKGSFCDLCEKLHNNFTEKVVYNLREWFLGQASCHS